MLRQQFSCNSENAADYRVVKYRKDKDSKPIPVLLDKTLRERIEKMSERMGEAKSTIMRMAMRLGLDTLEAALEIKPSILHQFAAEARNPNESGDSDTERIDKGVTDAVAADVRKKKKSPQ